MAIPAAWRAAGLAILAGGATAAWGAPGNCWHYPLNVEPGAVTMRNPVIPTPSGATYVYVGNYQPAADMTGGMVYYKKSTAGAWLSVGLSFDTAVGNNNYWKAPIPANAVAAGETLQYYVQVNYDNGGAERTFLGTTNQTGQVQYLQATNAAAHPFAATSAAVMGNCWHFPRNAEPAGATMRNPTNPAPDRDTYVYVGNYYEAGVGGADMTGGAVYYRKSTADTWVSAGLSYDSANGNNKYWKGLIPANAVAAGETLQYYLRVDYANGGADATYLGTTTQADNAKYAQATNAAAHPFAAVCAVIPPDFGNCWHYPLNAEPEGATMRNPTNPTPKKDTYLYVGNFQGDADMTGGWVFYKTATAGAWASNGFAFDVAAGSNNYWKALIPSNAAALGETLQYYLRVDYANGGADTTYLGTGTQADNVKYAAADGAAAHPFAALSTADLGNCWHAPANAEPAGAYMRNPRHPYANSAVSIYTGNQAYGPGTTGNQTGGTLYYRLQGAPAWTSVALAFDSEAGNNKFWRGVVPADTFGKTQTVEYVLAVTYTDRDTTYLGKAASGVASQSFAALDAAQAQPFDFTYGGDPGTEPGFVWHGGNAVKLAGDSVQLWVKIGYKNGADVWADHAEVRYLATSATRRSPKTQGARAVGARAADPTLTNVVAMAFDHEEQDAGANGNAMWWVGTVVDSNLAVSAEAVLRYQIAAWKSTTNGGNGVARLAEYQSDGANDQVYEYRMMTAGANALRVNGVNADYTTTKFFIDEALGETAHIRAEYGPPAGATDVQIFSNVGRRDFWNADLDANGVPDAIRPASGDLVTPATAGYFAAFSMAWDANAGAYVWEADVGKCGAYRLTARYKLPGDPAWHYYSELGSGIRDHAIVISPKKALRQNVYELNALTVKASAATEDGRSTLADLIDTSAARRGTFDEFGLEYLNKIQANCLWFQPVHTSSEYGVPPERLPGSPYSAKDYFAVGKWFGRAKTTAAGLAEFQQFVAACDAGKSTFMATSYVGTINVMLDGVFNHTSWDATFGEMGERLGLVAAGQGATTAIGSLRPGWYANYSDYGAPATFYNGPAGGQHNIACAPDRGDFGKWLDTAELFYGNYAALVRHNPENNGNHLNEGDWYDYASMTPQTEELWAYMGAYPAFWLEKTGHALTNRPGVRDANGVLLDDYGIDGLRCDFAQGLPPQFWEYAVNRTRTVKWNFIFMAESLDGGVVSYRSNRHFDVLNENFVFQIAGADSPAAVKNAVEDRKRIYSGGAILLNLTSHDEVMPYADPWATASRYAMVSALMGLPMSFYGQEQGIVACTADKTGKVAGDVVPGDRFTGFAKFELNMGKWVAHFGQWNQLLVWDEPPSAEWSRPMAQWYGRLNWARLNSPALRSGNQYFLGRKNPGTYDNGKIFAVAKVEAPGAVRNGQDAVLAFALFVNVGDHAGNNDVYDLTACWDLLGLSNSPSAFYNVRNLAASSAETPLWSAPKSGAELHRDGIWVSFDSDQGGRRIYDDGAIVQYLKIEAVGAPAPQLAIQFAPPGPIVVPYKELAQFAVAVADTNGQPVAGATTNLVGAQPGMAFSAGQFSYVVADSAWVGRTNGVEFSATAGAAATNAWMGIVVPTDSNANGIPDVWERTYFDDYVSAGPAAYREYVANTDPTNPNDDFLLTDMQVVDLQTKRQIVCRTASNRVYRIEFTDDSLKAASVAWHAFQNGGAWTNLSAAASHVFLDDGTAATSGTPLAAQRTYRVWVGLP